MAKSTKKEVIHNTVIIIRVSEKFKEELQDAAQKEDRNLSDFIRLYMKKLITHQ